jgi:hypothetical protein
VGRCFVKYFEVLICEACLQVQGYHFEQFSVSFLCCFLLKFKVKNKQRDF